MTLKDDGLLLDCYPFTKSIVGLVCLSSRFSFLTLTLNSPMDGTGLKVFVISPISLQKKLANVIV